MRGKSRLASILLLFPVFLMAFPAQSISPVGSDSPPLQFVVIDSGDISGYENETYVVVRNQSEWRKAWKKHTTPYLSRIPCPEIDFGEEIVICAFMGKRPTAGYSVSLERLWVEEEVLHIRIAKHAPPKDAIVCQAITHPYVFASTQRTAMEAVFHVYEENGTKADYTMPEFGDMTVPFWLLLTLSIVLIVMKYRRKQPVGKL